MKTPVPQIVALKTMLSGKDLAGRLPQVLALSKEAGLAEPTAFETPPGGRSKPIARLDPATLVNHQVEFILADSTRLSMSTHPGVRGTLVQVSRADDALTEEQVSRAQLQETSFLRGLLATGELLEGQVERFEAGLDALPSVPLARRLPAIVVTEDQVSKAFADPRPFWAAWNEHQVKAERHLLSRHLEAASTSAWFRACFDSQWDMARAARPGDTFYGEKVAPPGCEELLMRGESRLRQVGYRAGHVELAGFVPDGAHFPPWEILFWNEILLRGRLEDGSPVSSVRVVFRDERMARAEATPLLDIGADVAFLGRDGLYQSLA